MPVPSFGPGGSLQRPVSPLVEDAEGEEGEGDSSRRPTPGLSTPKPQATRSTANSFLRKCYPSSNPQVPFLPAGHLEDCLPPCYHGAKTMAKLIKVSLISLRSRFVVSK